MHYIGRPNSNSMPFPYQKIVCFVFSLLFLLNSKIYSFTRIDTIPHSTHEIIKKEKLVRADGILNTKGWARSFLFDFNKRDIRGKLKEWDNYNIIHPDFSLAVTCAKIPLAQIMLLKYRDHITTKIYSTTKIILLPFRKAKMPCSPDSGDIILYKRKNSLQFVRKSEERDVVIDFPKFIIDADTGISAELILNQENDKENISIALPWKENSYFFTVSQKIIAMPVEGKVQIGKKEISLSAKDTYAVLDWGRTVRPKKNNWQWGFGCLRNDTVTISWNIGTRNDTTDIGYSQNIIFYNGIGHKIDTINIAFDKTNLLTSWKITSSNHRFEMIFTPFMKEASKRNYLFFKNDLKQVMGYYNGYVILDNGNRIEIKNALGLLEDVHNE